MSETVAESRPQGNRAFFGGIAVRIVARAAERLLDSKKHFFFMDSRLWVCRLWRAGKKIFVRRPLITAAFLFDTKFCRGV